MKHSQLSKIMTKQPDTCTICGSMSLRLLADMVTSDPILSPQGMKIYRCERCKGFTNEYLLPSEPEECWTCNHCQVSHTPDMTVGHEDEHGKTCEECWVDMSKS